MSDTTWSTQPNPVNALSVPTWSAPHPTLLQSPILSKYDQTASGIIASIGR